MGWEKHNTCVWILHAAPAYGSKSTVVVAPTAIGRMAKLGSTVPPIRILLPLSFHKSSLFSRCPPPKPYVLPRLLALLECVSLQHCYLS